MENLDVRKYIDIIIRRKWWVIIPFLSVLLAGLAYSLTKQKIYQGETLILIVPQKVPANFVRPIVSTDMETRLRSIRQQVTSRTNLERMIKQYSLYSGPSRKNMLLEEKVELFRKRIGVTVHRGTTFKIDFRDEDPKKAMSVANALTSNFINENLKLRESQALGTSDFLREELETARKRLAKKDELLKQYQLKHMGAMPKDLQTNLNTLTRLQTELESLSANLRDAENRKLIVQQQIANMEKIQSQISAGLKSNPEGESAGSLPNETQDSPELSKLRRQLALLEARYTENHPDVKRLKEIIRKMEKETFSAGQSDHPALEESSETLQPPLPMGENFLQPQFEQIQMEIMKLKREISKVKKKAQLFEKRVEETPQREQELLSLKRDYDNLKNLYDSLLKRKLEADIAVSMEKKQKGEQFRMIDAAKIPEKPISPDLRKILLLAVALGLGLGGGLAYVVEMLDSSLKSPSEVEKELEIPVLVSLPIRYTQKELRRIKVRRILAYVSVSVGFVAAAFAIVIAAKGLDKTLEFVNGIIGRI